MPFGMTGQPGANFGGVNVAVPNTGTPGTAAVGSSTNPLLPTMPSGQTTPSLPQPGFGVTAPTNLGGTPPNGLGFNAGSMNSFIKGMQDAGYSKGDAQLMWNFLKTGAGFNPQIAQALINFMQPQVQRGEADILEQFSNMGLRYGSPAAVGMGDFLSQVNLNEQEVFAQMEEKAIQNYLSILMAGKKTDTPDNTLAGLGQLAGGGAQLLTALSGVDWGNIFCWVASALYGSNSLRTRMLRAWLLNHYSKTMLGSVLVAAYKKFGKRLAKSKLALWALRPLFNMGVNRAYNHYAAEVA